MPLHLRNAPTQLMKELGYGKGYRYAHDEEGGFAAGESYLPDGMDAPRFYRAGARAGSRSASARGWRELRRLNDEASRPKRAERGGRPG